MADNLTEKVVDWREYIVCNPDVLCGKPTLKGTRLSVEFVLGLLAGDWDRKAIRENYPNLTEERIRAVLSYAAYTFSEDRFHLLPPVAATP
ncbi:MAG: DUF433 domain-containing protein [Phycisphaerales bacterium]|nr:DUF433 domain-containing protein [Phycisphaerales bacterium]